MTKKGLIITCLLLVNVIFAQKKSKAEVLQIIADDTCECIKNDTETFNKGVSMSKKEVALGLCMYNSFEKRKKLSKAFKNKSGLDAIEDIAEDIGALMISTCGSEFLNAFSSEDLSEALDEDEEVLENMPPPPPAPKNENDFIMEAKLLSVHNEGLSFIKVTDDFDKEHTFLIVNQFEGDNLIKQSNKNKTVKIYYTKEHFYDLSENSYVKKKVVKYIEEVN